MTRVKSKNTCKSMHEHERVFTSAYKTKMTQWPESAGELYQPSDRRLSAKLMPNFEDKGCHMVSAMNPYCRILGFLDLSLYFSSK
jgi:hypothetical protein